MENKFTPELIEKAKQVNSAEELTALAKENNIELSEDKAKEYFERLIVTVTLKCRLTF